MKTRTDKCDHCGKKIRFMATRDGELPGLEFCGAGCMDRHRAKLRKLSQSGHNACKAEEKKT